MSHNAKYGNLKSWVVKEEKTFRRKYSADTPTDTPFVDFGCASSSSQSKKDGVIEVDGFGEIFVKFSFNKFRINEAKICLNCKETHFNWLFQLIIIKNVLASIRFKLASLSPEMRATDNACF